MLPPVDDRTSFSFPPIVIVIIVVVQLGLMLPPIDDHTSFPPIAIVIVVVVQLSLICIVALPIYMTRGTQSLWFRPDPIACIELRNSCPVCSSISSETGSSQLLILALLMIFHNF
jgi:hypothetical protein